MASQLTMGNGFTLAIPTIFGAVLVHTPHSALEDRECAFNRVRVDRAIRVIEGLLRALFDSLYRDVLLP